MTGLVLSLFPGIGLLDMAFEAEGFCIVRGPDLLWGGDIKRFHPPTGKFDGVIGGPPCQIFSRMRHIQPLAGAKHGNLIPEFARVVDEASPDWFIMENVPEAPGPAPVGYSIKNQIVRDVWVGGETSRERRFTFGAKFGARAFQVDTLALHNQQPAHAVMASGGMRAVPVALGGSGKVKSTRRVQAADAKTEAAFKVGVRLQGLPDDFLADAPFTVAGKIKAVGNGVPLPMGRAIAEAVKAALAAQSEAA